MYVCMYVFECVLGFYLVHEHIQKYDKASEDAFYQVEELIVSVDSAFGII